MQLCWVTNLTITAEPNNASPLNTEAASLWDSPDEFKAQLVKHYKPIVEDSA